MEDGLKTLSTPFQFSDQYLEDVELQACQLFEEFLCLPEPVQCLGFGNPVEVADSPLSSYSSGHESFKLKRSVGKYIVVHCIELRINLVAQ